MILGSTEADIAESFSRAAEVYKNDPTALQLRGMNMIYESIRNKGGLVLAPSAALDSMNLGTVLGAAAHGVKSGIIPRVMPDTSPGEAGGSPSAVSEEDSSKEGDTP